MGDMIISIPLHGAGFDISGCKSEFVSPPPPRTMLSVRVVGLGGLSSALLFLVS